MAGQGGKPGSSSSEQKRRSTNPGSGHFVAGRYSVRYVTQLVDDEPFRERGLCECCGGGDEDEEEECCTLRTHGIVLSVMEMVLDAWIIAYAVLSELNLWRRHVLCPEEQIMNFTSVILHGLFLLVDICMLVGVLGERLLLLCLIMWFNFFRVARWLGYMVAMLFMCSGSENFPLIGIYVAMAAWELYVMLFLYNYWFELWTEAQTLESQKKVAEGTAPPKRDSALAAMRLRGGSGVSWRSVGRHQRRASRRKARAESKAASKASAKSNANLSSRTGNSSSSSSGQSDSAASRPAGGGGDASPDAATATEPATEVLTTAWDVRETLHKPGDPAMAVEMTAASPTPTVVTSAVTEEGRQLEGEQETSMEISAPHLSSGDYDRESSPSFSVNGMTPDTLVDIIPQGGHAPSDPSQGSDAALESVNVHRMILDNFPIFLFSTPPNAVPDVKTAPDTARTIEKTTVRVTQTTPPVSDADTDVERSPEGAQKASLSFSTPAIGLETPSGLKMLLEGVHDISLVLPTRTEPPVAPVAVPGSEPVREDVDGTSPRRAVSSQAEEILEDGERASPRHSALGVEPEEAALRDGANGTATAQLAPAVAPEASLWQPMGAGDAAPTEGSSGAKPGADSSIR